MAGYVMTGNPLKYTGIVNENEGIAGGVFVELDSATGKITLADAETAPQDLYFTDELKHGDYIGSDSTTVEKKDALQTINKLAEGDEVCLTLASTTGFAKGDKLVVSSGVVAKLPTAAGTYTVIGRVKEVTTFATLPALQIRYEYPHSVTVA